jgi:hypothetical protein
MSSQQIEDERDADGYPPHITITRHGLPHTIRAQARLALAVLTPPSVTCAMHGFLRQALPVMPAAPDSIPFAFQEHLQ